MRRTPWLVAVVDAVVLVAALLAAAFGPHPAYIWHRLLPGEGGAAGFIGHRYHQDGQVRSVGLIGTTVVCVDRGCRFQVSLRRPGDVPPDSEIVRVNYRGWVRVDRPMLWLERVAYPAGRSREDGPDVTVVDALPP